MDWGKWIAFFVVAAVVGALLGIVIAELGPPSEGVGLGTTTTRPSSP